MSAEHLIIEADQVTAEILQLAYSIVDGWYSDGTRIDWEDFLYRMDSSELDDGSRIDLGNSMLSPAIRKIKSEVRKYRRL